MRISRLSALLALALALLAGFAVAQGAQPIPASSASPSAEPVNPHATPEARALLKKIDQISGRETLTGQHNFPNHLSRWSDRIYDLTGKFPAIFGQDFGFAGGDDKDSVEGRPAMIEEVERQYRNGAVIALTWHAVRPTEDEPVTFRDSVLGHLTDFEWNELLTPGTDLNSRWAEQVDVIAGYLRQLQDAGVPVLFRPYHEMNGNWFWWGGRPGPHGSAALYRQLYDRFVNLHHLNNLVWVWNVNSPSENAGPIADYFPGARYADLVTMDIYGEFKQSYYDGMVALAGDKPIAMAEVGAMPTLDVLARQPRWAYFMMWSGMAETANAPAVLQANFHAPNLLNRGDAPFTPPGTTNAHSIDAATPDAVPAVNALLRRLYDAEPAHVLSGEENNAADPTGATQQVVLAAHKSPSIYGEELGTGPDATNLDRAVLDEAIRQSKAQSIVSLRWMPTNPAEPDNAANTASATNRSRLLTDFEWKELMTPGTHLNQLWSAQVDAAADALKQLDDKGIAVLWTPYPDSNSQQNWWAGRTGIHGSAALYRMLFDRLVSHDHIHNLVWVWEAVPPRFGPGATGALTDYFPGLLYVDTLALHGNQTQSRFRSDALLASFAVGKPIGLFMDGPAPAPDFFDRETGWSWFLLAPQAAETARDASDTSATALRTLYADPRIESR